MDIDDLAARLHSLERRLARSRKLSVVLLVGLLALAACTVGPLARKIPQRYETLTVGTLRLESRGAIGELDARGLLLGGTDDRYSTSWPISMEAAERPSLHLGGPDATSWLVAGRLELATSGGGRTELDGLPHLTMLAPPDGVLGGGALDAGPAFVWARGAGGATMIAGRAEEIGVTVTDPDGRVLLRTPGE